MDEPSAQPEAESSLDLVGEPFAVIESDPGVFTSLARKLGIRGLELVELYDIEPWAVDHLHPRGLVFCFLWRKDAHRPSDFDDPAAERVWFANQLSDDACASLAILNIALNTPDIEIGEELTMFRQETESMSPVVGFLRLELEAGSDISQMKGLAISSSPFIRKAHRSLARCVASCCFRALNAIATSTLDGAKKKKNSPVTKRNPAKSTTSKAASSSKAKKEESDGEEAYHFIGYVPAYGKVWELDGLKSGPLEVGELSDDAHGERKTWMDVVRPALRMKMQKYGGAEGGNNIRFSLLALVDGLYEKASDNLEFLKRERLAIQRRMKPDWESLVDSNLLEQAQFAFESPVGSSAPGRTYARDFGARRMARDLEILEMPERALVPAWEQCVRDAVKAKVAVEDEVAKATRANTEHIKRTHDYEPFFKEFVTCLQDEGLLEPLLDVNDDAKKTKRVKLNGKG
ncbi:Ubiquitin carboxyl-terminal hydrolase isozyme L5 [Mycena venus]|uniref:ubiquitinyl hydrolase 1 n=1 Tax=Mycena venus TaxID=2733690 RepID=A0A8H7D8A6_9AGAR|nr:Ubiquitin carboxyl-terminal hydrolase isozyme L5 [Mycena venus]